MRTPEKKTTVDKVCANIEIRILNGHHIQALSLKRVLHLTSKFFFNRISIKDGSENDKATVRDVSCICHLDV